MKSGILAIALCALIVSGCDEAPITASSDGAMEKGGPTTPASPALTYQGVTTVKGTSYRTVAVMDADGKNQTNLYGTSRPVGTFFGSQSWNPSGTSISFVENASTTVPSYILKAIDVSVNSSGAAVGTNPRTIYTPPAGYAIAIGAAWSSTSRMDKIAFALGNSNTTDRTLWVVPQSGGAAIRVWGSDASYVKEDGSVIGHSQALAFTAWSPDDERLAVVRYDSSGTSDPYAVSTIMIFNTADNGYTWTYSDSIKVRGIGNTSVFGLEWSRGVNGVNKLAYSDIGYNANKGQIFYVDPVTGAVPTTQGVLGRLPCWSPDNTTIIFNNRAGNGDYMGRINAFATGVTNVVANPAYLINPVIRWKR